jgi:acyl-coenzyme A synthetase/AMP-(fatty) acid ligase
VPKAFVVKAPDSSSKPDAEVARILEAHVAEHKASYKWLKGGVEFLDVIPKSPSGKILRRLLRDRERDARRRQGGRL